MDSTTQKLKGNWYLIKDRLQEEYDELTDEDLIYFQGKERDLVQQIHVKTGVDEKRIKAFIDNL